MNSVRILIADDHEIMQEGLYVLVQDEPKMDVVGQARDGQEAVRLARKLSPDVVIMDVGMPDLNGIEATRQIVEECHGVKIVALSMYSDKRYVMGMLKAGASGYLLKDGAFQELVRAIRSVVAGKVYLSPAIAGVVVDASVRSGSSRRPLVDSSLTDREQDVLQLLAEGHSTKQIASQLKISEKTVETHRHRLMEKLDIHSIAELTKYALREGLTSLGG